LLLCTTIGVRGWLSLPYGEENPVPATDLQQRTGYLLGVHQGQIWKGHRAVANTWPPAPTNLPPTKTGITSSAIHHLPYPHFQHQMLASGHKTSLQLGLEVPHISGTPENVYFISDGKVLLSYPALDTIPGR